MLSTCFIFGKKEVVLGDEDTQRNQSFLFTTFTFFSRSGRVTYTTMLFDSPNLPLLSWLLFVLSIKIHSLLKAIFKGAYDRESNEIITNYDHFSFVVIKQTAEPVFTIELSIFKSLKFNSIYSNRENIIQTFRMQPLSPRHEKKNIFCKSVNNLHV